MPVTKRASKLECFSTISLNSRVLYLKLGQLLRWSTVRSTLEKVPLSFASIRIDRENLSVKNTAAYFDRYFSDEKKRLIRSSLRRRHVVVGQKRRRRIGRGRRERMFPGIFAAGPDTFLLRQFCVALRRVALVVAAAAARTAFVGTGKIGTKMRQLIGWRQRRC